MTNLQSAESEDLNQLSKVQIMAILPVEILQESQKEMADMFRQNLYANLKKSNFNLIEHNVIDDLLQKHKLTEPSKYHRVTSITFGEILGADAVILTRVNKVELSPIQLSFSVKMLDTRTGKLLWRAKQTESDFRGVGKIPRSIVKAMLASIQVISNELKLRKVTLKMAHKPVNIHKDSIETEEETTFKEPKIVSTAEPRIKGKEEIQNLKSEKERSVEMDKMEVLTPPSPSALPEDPDTNEVSTVQKSQRNQSIKTDVSTIQQKKQEGKPTRLNMKTGKIDTEIEKHNASASSIQKTEAKAKESLKQKETVQPKEEKSEEDQEKAKEKAIQQAQNQPVNSWLYSVQVGAYTNQNFADEMTIKLIKKGYQAFTSSSKGDEANLYKVQVGRFIDKKKALELAYKIHEKEKLANFIITQQ